MEVVGHDDLQGRSAYQPTIISQNGREIAYVGHHDNQKPIVNPMTGKPEINGTSVVDVTDPARPKYLAHIASGRGGAQMARVCSGDTLPQGVKGKWYLLRPYGNSAHELYDVTDPAKPTKLVTIVDGLERDSQELVGVRHRHRVSGRQQARRGLARRQPPEDL